MTDKILGRKYHIGEPIGSGGMAVVYKARVIGTNKTVAVKVLREEYRENPEFVRRFEREARAALSLSHENIVRTYDVGNDDGVYYIVMEYVQGKTLKEILSANGPLPPKIAISLACQVLDALACAHGKGIIHRDVKPQNVIVTPYGKAKLADFGIAMDVNASTRTFAGHNVLGSVHYISPEQARGDEIKPYSDIYSVGIMLYEMLIGRVPFDGDTTVTVALKHLQETITPPCVVNDKVSSSLSDIVVKAASKNPDDRYQTAQAMRHDLQRSLKEPNGKFARQKPETAKPRKRSLMWIAPVVLLAAAIIFVGAYYIGRSKQPTQLNTADYVPRLVDKKIEDGIKLANDRGYTVEEAERVESLDYPEGTIISQSPTEGAKSNAAHKITVVVSKGSDFTKVPALYGKTQTEAIEALSNHNLKLGTVKYDETSELAPGTVISQSPEEGATLEKGDSVDIVLSGAQTISAEMISVTGKPLYTAILDLKTKGFENIFISVTPTDDKSLDETVISQSVEQGVAITITDAVTLEVARTNPGIYVCDIAFNIDVATNDSQVIVAALLNNGAKQILYSETMQAGKQIPISFTGYLRSAGEYYCIVYVNGVEVRRGACNFKFKG